MNDSDFLRKVLDIRGYQNLSGLLLSESLESCKLTFQHETRIVTIRCSSDQLMAETWRKVPTFIHRLLGICDHVKVESEITGRNISAPVDLICKNFLQGLSTMKQSPPASVEFRRLEEEIHSCDLPQALVSIHTHRNLIVNSALENYLQVEESDLKERDLRLYWLAKEELLPERIQSLLKSSLDLPSSLAEVLEDLKQTAKLENRKYRAWKENVYGVYTANIELVELPNFNFARKMTTLDFQPLG